MEGAQQTMKATIQVRVSADLDPQLARVFQYLPPALLSVVVNALIREYAGRLPKGLPFRLEDVEIATVNVEPEIHAGPA